MKKTFKLRSKFLNTLNEAIQKLALTDNVKILKNPFMEADGNFTSVVKTDDNFDPTKINSNILIDQEDDKDEDQLAKKTSLTAQAINKIKQSLQTSDELQSILSQINSINAENNNNKWVVNEENNTAELKDKNAYIFKQNKNLCLSYDDKIEIFKSVAELHDWLNKHDFPLPKNIKLRESKQKLFESPWNDILNNKSTNNGMHIGDIKFDTEIEKEELEQKSRKPIVKMGNAEYKDAMKFIDKKDKPQQIIPGLPTNENALDKNEFWYLLYINKSNSENLYLNSEWVNNNLLTNNLEMAAAFLTREESMNELDKVYSLRDTDAPFMPVQENTFSECFGGGTTTGILGSGIQYLANKKEENLNEEDLEETFYGYPGTPFEGKVYEHRYNRGSEYLKWINSKRDDQKINIDPNNENMALAKADVEITKIYDRGAKHWRGSSVPKGGDPMFKDMFNREDGKIKNKEEFNLLVDRLNKQYNLDIHADEPVWTYRGNKMTGAPGFEISDHNRKQRQKWIEEIWKNKHLNNIKGISHAADQRVKEYQSKLNNVTNSTQSNEFNQELNRLINIHDTFDPSEPVKFFNELQSAKNKLQPEEFNLLVDKLIQASDEGEIDASPVITSFWKTLKTSEQKESTAFRNLFTNLIGQRLQEITLTEDDTPADFASNIASDMSNASLDTSNTSTEDPVSTETPQDIQTDTLDTNTAPQANFGDINVGLDGDYGPDVDDETQIDLPPQPEYRIIDVLINDQDHTETKVKVKNIETGEEEIKYLYEIDV